MLDIDEGEPVRVEFRRVAYDAAATAKEIVDAGLPHLDPDTTLGAVTRYFAAYNLVCGPVLDEEGHLLGAVTVDDVLDHLLPDDWRESYEEPVPGPGLGAVR